ncbi:unnamed protein product [Heterobilharzia americana]|nr:unnamed protein product [Heterobilharzia americana]
MPTELTYYFSTVTLTHAHLKQQGVNNLSIISSLTTCDEYLPSILVALENTLIEADVSFIFYALADNLKSCVINKRNTLLSIWLATKLFSRMNFFLLSDAKNFENPIVPTSFQCKL